MPGTNYIYSDEDNAPMNDENVQAPDRGCRNCEHQKKVAGRYITYDECELWECKFEQKEGS